MALLSMWCLRGFIREPALYLGVRKMSASLKYEGQGNSATHVDSGDFDIESHREELESIANSDLPANWIAETILKEVGDD